LISRQKRDFSKNFKKLARNIVVNPRIMAGLFLLVV
jgi:hypothetical protein